MNAVIANLFRSATHLIYPNVCLICESLLRQTESDVCDACQNGFDGFLLPDESTALMTAQLQRHQHNQTIIDDAFALYNFHKQGNLQTLIHGIKYDGLSRLAIEQGRRLGESILSARPALQLHAIVPMPLHPIRKLERGYNQAERLATGVAQVLNAPVRELIKRIRYTATQTGFDLQGRQENIKDAFLCEAKLNGESILIIDDVFTTGSTLFACAKPLKEQGAGRIAIAALAIAAS